MAFPSNPSNGDTTTQFGRVYSYNATLDAWILVSTTANTEVYFTANAAFETANSAGEYANSSFITANAAFDAANNATDSWVRDAANSASDYANSSFITANASFEAANNATDSWVRDAANSASSYANSAYTAANSSTGVTYTINTSPPASGNTIGDIWIDSDDGILYTWLDDGDSYQWIELGPTPGAISSSGGSGGSDPSVVYTYSILFGA